MALRRKKYHNRFFHDDRDLELRLTTDTGQTQKRPYMKRDEIDQRADSRCPLGRAGGIEAR
jgi:hypothetical protein